MVLRLGSSRIEKEKNTFMSDVQTNIGFAEGGAPFSDRLQGLTEATGI
jgi:hypothetical protein